MALKYFSCLSRQLTYGVLVLFAFFFLEACNTPVAKTFDFPKPVDTSTRSIVTQQKKTYVSPDGTISIDNQFPSARISGLHWVDRSTVDITIEPENAPINPSPWYAFRIVSKQAQQLTIKLDYGDAYHRYFPKLSVDGENWVSIDSSYFRLGEDTTSAYLNLNLPADTFWVAGQELWPSNKVIEWVDALDERSSWVRQSIIGESRMGRPLVWMDIYKDSPKRKPTIVLFSRQHPPEVTGFLALHAFMDELLFSELSEQFFEHYRVMVYPLINPDGVDMGHWRHNTGGIDLNRDWAYFRQPESKTVANHVVRTLAKDKNDLQLGMDFHSTWKDVYYTPDKSVMLKKHQDFCQLWHARIERLVGNGFKVNDGPSPIGRPTTAGWFSTQFGVPGITYEVGDSTPRPFIDQKARASAQAMMEILLSK